MVRETAINCENFEEVISSYEDIVIVECLTGGKGLTYIMEPVINQIKEVYGSRLSLFKIDLNEIPLLRSKYLITSELTYLIFKDGELVNTLPGLTPVIEFLEVLQAHFLNND